MILEKPDASAEAPPSYQTALQSNSGRYTAPPPAAPAKPVFPTASSFPTASPSTPRISGSSSSRRPTKPRSKSSPRWLPSSIFGLSKTAKQVRSTTQSLLRDLLTQQRPTTEVECTSVLLSCAEACSANNLSLFNILQDPFIEGHLPIYWAILKRPLTPVKTDAASRPQVDIEAEADALIMALLNASMPILYMTIAEVRHACLIVSNHDLFVRIRRRFKAFSPLSGPDAMLLGNNGMNPDMTDAVTVQEVRGEVGAFVARFDIVLFQLRMRVSKSVKVEFIARGRLWYLVFSAATESGSGYRVGAWLVTLGLADHSPPTWVDGRLVVEDNSQPYLPPRPASGGATPLRSIGGTVPPPPPRHASKDKPRPSVSLPIKSGSRELSPPQPNPSAHHEIVVPLDKSMMGANLQLEGTSYIDSSGTLSARLEANLSKPDSDSSCIIC